MWLSNNCWLKPIYLILMNRKCVFLLFLSTHHPQLTYRTATMEHGRRVVWMKSMNNNLTPSLKITEIHAYALFNIQYFNFLHFQFTIINFFWLKITQIDFTLGNSIEFNNFFFRSPRWIVELIPSNRSRGNYKWKIEHNTSNTIKHIQIHIYK